MVGGIQKEQKELPGKIDIFCKWARQMVHYLVFQRTQVQYPTPVWRLRTICNSSSKRPNALFWTLQAMQECGA